MCVCVCVCVRARAHYLCKYYYCVNFVPYLHLVDLGTSTVDPSTRTENLVSAPGEPLSLKPYTVHRC